MPVLKRRGPTRRTNAYDLSSLGIVDRLLLHIGPHEDAETLKTENDMRAVWEANRAELSTMRTGRKDPLWGVHHAPGQRTWPEWRFELLPDDPRRRVVYHPTLPLTTDKPPSGPGREPWGTDGYECPYLYLRRRGLLKPGEEDAIRECWPLEKVHKQREAYRHWVELHRPQSAYRSSLHELMALAAIYDPDGRHGLLTAEERRIVVEAGGM